MCHPAHIHVLLSAEDKKGVPKLAGIMVPVYASLLPAVVMITGGSRQDELIAARPASSATP